MYKSQFVLVTHNPQIFFIAGALLGHPVRLLEAEGATIRSID